MSTSHAVGGMALAFTQEDFSCSQSIYPFFIVLNGAILQDLKNFNFNFNTSERNRHTIWFIMGVPPSSPDGRGGTQSSPNGEGVPNPVPTEGYPQSVLMKGGGNQSSPNRGRGTPIQFHRDHTPIKSQWGYPGQIRKGYTPSGLDGLSR